MRIGYHAKRTPTELHTHPYRVHTDASNHVIIASVATVDVVSAKTSLVGASRLPSLIFERLRRASCQQSSVVKRNVATNPLELRSCAAGAKQGDQVSSGMREVAGTRRELTCYTVVLGHVHCLGRVPTAARSAAEAVSRAFGRAKFSLYFHSSEAKEPRVIVTRPWRTRCRCASREKTRASGRTGQQK